MDEELDTGAAGESTNDGPSLLDTLSSELGLDGAAPGGDAGEGADTGAAPATTSTPAPAAQPGDTAPAGAAATGADGAVVDPAAGAKPDPNAALYAPLPEHNSRATMERFQKLVTGHKEVSAENETLKAEREQQKGQIANYEAGLQHFRDMGFTDEAGVRDLVQFSDFRKALRTGDHQGALRIIQPILQELQLKAGGALNIDPLTAFPDIGQRVQVGEIDYPTALELARARHGERLQSQQTQARQQQEQQHGQQMAAISAGTESVKALDRQLQLDPDYAAVLPAVLKQLPYIKEQLQPAQWAAEVKRTFEYEKRLLLVQARQATPARPSQTPLRASGHGGGAPTPKTAADAAMQSIGLDA